MLIYNEPKKKISSSLVEVEQAVNCRYSLKHRMRIQEYMKSPRREH